MFEKTLVVIGGLICEVKVIGLPEADRIAQKNGYQYAEHFVQSEKGQWLTVRESRVIEKRQKILD